MEVRRAGAAECAAEMSDDNKENEMARRLGPRRGGGRRPRQELCQLGRGRCRKMHWNILAAAARAKPAVAQLPAGAVDNRMIATQALYAVAHNIKGQGSSFGFHLMTRLGDSLCLPDPRQAAVLGRRAQSGADPISMPCAWCSTQEIRGDGGALGEKLAQRLETLVAEVLGDDGVASKADLIRYLDPFGQPDGEARAGLDGAAQDLHSLASVRRRGPGPYRGAALPRRGRSRSCRASAGSRDAQFRRLLRGNVRRSLPRPRPCRPWRLSVPSAPWRHPERSPRHARSGRSTRGSGAAFDHQFLEGLQVHPVPAPSCAG